MGRGHVDIIGLLLIILEAGIWCLARDCSVHGQGHPAPPWPGAGETGAFGRMLVTLPDDKGDPSFQTIAPTEFSSSLAVTHGGLPIILGSSSPRPSSRVDD